MFSKFVNGLFDYLSGLPMDYLLYAAWGGYLFIFVLALFLTVKSKKVKQSPKGPFLCFTNTFTALTLCIFLTRNNLGPSLLAAALFWCVGYVLYGLLSFCSRERTKRNVENAAAKVTPAYATQPPRELKKELPPLNSTVQLDHAVAVTDKLLSKNVGNGDRQELEKMKLTLSTLKQKGNLTPSEGEILNENFNALLKLMAKYEV